MLKSLNFSQLLSFDLYDLAKVSLQIFDQCSIHKPALNYFIEDVRKSLACYEQTFKRRVISCIMEKKTLQASKRDEAFIAFYRMVEAGCHRTSKRQATLAGELYSVLQKHAWSTGNSGHQVQAKSLPGLIYELEYHYLEIIEHLGASDWFDDLVRAQRELEALSDEKKIGPYKEISVRETRPILESSMRALFRITDSLYQAAPDEEMGQIVNNLNKVVGKLSRNFDTKPWAESFN